MIVEVLNITTVEKTENSYNKIGRNNKNNERFSKKSMPNENLSEKTKRLRMKIRN